MSSFEPVHVLLLEARFYEDVADQMLRGATEVLASHHVTHSRLWVPGSFELPAALAFAVDAAATDPAARPDGYVVLGCVIEGETDHYAHICRETSRALMDLAVRHRIALGFGVLTCRTYEQAWERARIDGQNKGGDAARACLHMIDLKRAFARGLATGAAI